MGTNVPLLPVLYTPAEVGSQLDTVAGKIKVELSYSHQNLSILVRHVKDLVRGAVYKRLPHSQAASLILSSLYSPSVITYLGVQLEQCSCLSQSYPSPPLPSHSIPPPRFLVRGWKVQIPT